MINVRKYTFGGCLLIALLLGACAPFEIEQPQPELITLKVVTLPYLVYAPFFIAEEEGYFVEQGLQIELVELKRISEAIATLVQGEVDVSAGLVNVGVMNAMAREGAIKVVADIGYVAPTGCASDALIARRALVEGGELDNPTQLRGRRIALNDTSFEGYYVEKLLNTASLTLDDVEIVDIPTPTEPEALEKGTIDLTATSEPWVTRMLQAGHAVLWMPLHQVVPDFQFAFVLYGPTLLDENLDAGRRFMVAYLKAVQQYNQGKTERNLEILAKHTDLDEELLKQACWPSFHDDGQINVQSVLDFQEWAVGKEYLDSPITEEQFWDPSFIEYANEILRESLQ